MCYFTRCVKITTTILLAASKRAVNTSNPSARQTLEIIYKSDAPRLLAVLTRILGIENIELAEDTLQEAFYKALTQWQSGSIPPNPRAWLVTAAKNQAIDTIRANKNKIKLTPDLALFLESEWSLPSTIDAQFSDDLIQDDQLRMIFACCNTNTSVENQIPIILQILCGLNIDAISRALLIPVATVKNVYCEPNNY